MANTPSLTTTALVSLMKIKGVGRRAALRIIDREIDPTDGRDHVLSKAALVKASESDLLRAWVQSEDELANAYTSGINAYSLYDQGYPARLKDTPDPPAVLYVKGSPKGLHSTHCIAIVGTREPTSYGEKVARKSAATAAHAGFVIVSGLAHGCDTLAHEGCVDARGVGIAVLAHGLDKVYPAANRGLAQRLLDLGGCMVSEYPLGVTPMRNAFAERDRIQSGLSDGVLVIETDIKGGTMHTVRFSREQHRALACIEHPSTMLYEQKTKGNQKLLADRWAVAIADSEALSQFLNHLMASCTQEVEPAVSDKSDPQMSMRF